MVPATDSLPLLFPSLFLVTRPAVCLVHEQRAIFLHCLGSAGCAVWWEWSWVLGWGLTSCHRARERPVQGGISLPLNQQKVADVFSSSLKIPGETQLCLGRGHSNMVKGCYPLKNLLLWCSYFHTVAELRSSQEPKSGGKYSCSVPGWVVQCVCQHCGCNQFSSGQ